MGVLECNTKDCTNIMCNHYIPRVGYICNTCIDGFKNMCEREGISFTTESEIEIAIGFFIEISVDPPSSENCIDLDEYFNSINIHGDSRDF